MRESIELRGEEVKKEAFMEVIKAIVVNDLGSNYRDWEGGAAGGGAGRSWAVGVMEVQTFEALWRAPNTTQCACKHWGRR
jgi:translation initiation factor 2 gamma subunit (eIF-2gamma)